jgi:hypothetical protein
MTKLARVAVAFTVLFSLTACADDPVDPASTSTATAPTSAPASTATTDSSAGGVTAPGTELSLGDTAILPFKDSSKDPITLKVAVTDIKQATEDDLSSLDDNVKQQLADQNVWFVQIEVSNASSTATDDYSSAHLGVAQFRVLDQNGDRLGLLLLLGSFKPCPRPDFGKGFSDQTIIQTCVAFLSPTANTPATVLWADSSVDNSYDPKNGSPVSWHK